MQDVSVIGSGFAGLSAACILAKEGLQVSLYEKNTQPGGRARVFETKGYKFDMGPSWYWMPDVFESFFNQFNYTSEDFYKLKRLDPSYRVFFSEDDVVDIPADRLELFELFESIEPGSSFKLEKFLDESKYKYETGIKSLVYKPGLAITEYFDKRVFKGLFRLHLFQSIHQYLRKNFKDPRILKLLEFPVLFLGAMPKETPALYSLMNYADIELGTWYPMGGMNKIVEALTSIAASLGVQFHYNSPVEQVLVKDNQVSGIKVKGSEIPVSNIIAGADYHHVEQKLLPEKYQNYNEKYWNSRVMAPSSLVFYLGINKKLKNLLHHNLFFDKDFEQHSREIYKEPSWPENPLFYVCCPSKTDPGVAPSGKENLFILIPIAPGIEDKNEIRERYFDIVMTRLEKLTRQSIQENIEYKRSYSIKDFKSDYNAFKGNAYGLANTLNQTALLKPSIKNKKVRNLFYTGQLTVPGPGVPPSLISGQVAANQIIKKLKTDLKYEGII